MADEDNENRIYTPSEAWAEQEHVYTNPYTSETYTARELNEEPVPDPTEYKEEKPKKKRRKVSAAAVVATILVSILVLVVVGFGTYLLGTQTGRAEGYKSGYAAGSSTVMESANSALNELQSLSSSSSSVSSSLKAMLPLVNPCSEKYGNREASQTTWGQYGWGCKFSTDDGQKFSVLIGESNRSNVGKPKVERRRNGQTKGCIATGSPSQQPAFGLTVWVADSKDSNSCDLARKKWVQVAKESGR
ncbi:MAG TPA: hypothetical protein GX530_00220 [Corynebacteriales bacterium]|nr:hypothetical protein [Mycobacteriales bacterium]